MQANHRRVLGSVKFDECSVFNRDRWVVVGKPSTEGKGKSKKEHTKLDRALDSEEGYLC